MSNVSIYICLSNRNSGREIDKYFMYTCIFNLPPSFFLSFFPHFLPLSSIPTGKRANGGWRMPYGLMPGHTDRQTVIREEKRRKVRRGREEIVTKIREKLLFDLVIVTG